MTKTHKAVLSTLAVLCLLFMGSGVAQAQRCEARAATGDNAVANVRAEGMTEMIGGIELRCVPSEDTGSLFAVTDFTLSVTLNTPITSLANLNYVDAAQLNADGTTGGTAIQNAVFEAADNGDGPMIDEDEDPNTVVWEELSGASLGLGTGGNGFNVTIAGIRANAYMVGDDGEISAQLTVNTKSVAPGAFDVSDVKTGLVVKVDDANVLQCRVGTTGMASISIMEGFVGALSNDDPYNMVEVNFSGIPDGVEVMITHTADNQTDEANDDMKVTLTGEGDAPTGGASMVEVMLDEDGDGDITYTVTNAGDMVQGNTLMVSFTWKEDTTIADGMVSVGFVSAAGTDNPQFADAAAVRVIGFDPCETRLRFPFVTNAGGFDTGIAFTNASNYGGTCMIKFYGAEANPADMETMEVPSWGSETYVLSVIAMGFQGFLDVDCDFENGYGFAFISNGFGDPSGTTAAQGYLAIKRD